MVGVGHRGLEGQNEPEEPEAAFSGARAHHNGRGGRRIRQVMVYANRCVIDRWTGLRRPLSAGELQHYLFALSRLRVTKWCHFYS